MTKSDLQNGMIVVTRDGKRWIVLLDVVIHGDKDSSIANAEGEVGFISLSDYNENLTIIDDSIGLERYDIMRIEKSLFFGTLPNPHKKNTITIWQRKEPKKMTVAEIEAILGYEVEIVSDK